MQSDSEPEKTIQPQPEPIVTLPAITPSTEPPITEFIATWRNRAFKLPELLAYLKQCKRVWLTITPLGVTISGREEHGVYIVQIELGPDDFSNYHCSGVGPLHIPLNANELFKKIKPFSDDKDTVQLKLNADLMEKKQLNLVVRGISFDQPWDTSNEDESPTLTGFKFTASGQFYLTDLLEILELAKTAEHVTITLKATLANKLCVYESDCSREITLKNAAVEAPCESVYTLDYLLSLLKYTKGKVLLSRTQLQLKFAQNYPLQLTIPLTSSSQINAFLAQRELEETANGDSEEEAEEDTEESPADSDHWNQATSEAIEEPTETDEADPPP